MSWLCFSVPNLNFYLFNWLDVHVRDPAVKQNTEYNPAGFWNLSVMEGSWWQQKRQDRGCKVAVKKKSVFQKIKVFSLE